MPANYEGLRRTPVNRRRPGPPRRSSRVLDAAYLAWLRLLPCWSCHVRAYRLIFSEPSLLYPGDRIRSEAAHIGLSSDRRGASQKFSDTTAIPLCSGCHTEDRESIHGIGVLAFFAKHGGDRDGVIAMFRKLYATPDCG